ncbi:MAG: N-acetylglucosamine kinase [Terriglobia bacterium]
MPKFPPRYFLGIDGGGSETIAWLADERGHVCARTMAGPSNPLKAGMRASQRELAAAARAVFREAGMRARPIEAICAGVAGTDRPAIRGKILAALRRAIPARHYLVTTDAAITLQSALGRKPGIVVISGTGSIAYGRDCRGRTLRVGGWGSLFDDAGSGYDLGRKAVAAALRDFDGRGPRTAMREALGKTIRVESIAQAGARDWAPHEIAALFPVVLHAASQGDCVARRLCEGAGRDLAEMAATLLKRLDPARRALPVVCAGGVFAASMGIRRSFARHLRCLAQRRKPTPALKVSLIRREPVEGALELAFELGCCGLRAISQRNPTRPGRSFGPRRGETGATGAP